MIIASVYTLLPALNVSIDFTNVLCKPCHAWCPQMMCRTIC